MQPLFWNFHRMSNKLNNWQGRNPMLSLFKNVYIKTIDSKLLSWHQPFLTLGADLLISLLQYIQKWCPLILCDVIGVLSNNTFVVFLFLDCVLRSTYRGAKLICINLMYKDGLLSFLYKETWCKIFISYPWQKTIFRLSYITHVTHSREMC